MSPELVQFLVAGILATAWIWMLGRPLIATFTRRTRSVVDEHLPPARRAEREESMLTGSGAFAPLADDGWAGDDAVGPDIGDPDPAQGGQADEGLEPEVAHDPAHDVAHDVDEAAIETNELPWLRSDDAEDAGLARMGSGLSWLTNWFEQPVERRRLQTMLGFAMATFASLLLAIALRGVFVQLLVLMVVGFAFYLAAAALIGARELRARESEIWEDQSGWEDRHSEVQSSGRDVVDGMLAEGFFGSTVDSPGLGQGQEVSPPDRSIFEPETRPERGSRTAAAEYVAELGLDGQDGDATDDQLETELEAEADSARSATFVTPSQARPRRNRRPKARPIYIEAEYDEEDESSKAVND